MICVSLKAFFLFIGLVNTEMQLFGVGGRAEQLRMKKLKNWVTILFSLSLKMHPRAYFSTWAWSWAYTSPNFNR